MREVPSAHRRGRIHRKGFGQLNARRCFDGKKLEERGFLRVIGASGIPWCWTNALVFLPDERIVTEGFLRVITPELRPDPSMQTLGKGFGQSVREGLEENAAVVIMGFFEAVKVSFDADPGRYGKAADIINETRTVGGDKVCQGIVRLPWRFAGLLAKMMETGQGSGQRFVLKDQNVIALSYRREES